MKYSMIVTDMDDTLLNSEGKISEIDREAIMRAQEKGVKFVLASGRPTYAMRKTAQELELKKYGSYLLSFNGAIITDLKNDEVLFKEALEEHDVHELYDFSRVHDVQIITYGDDYIISADEGKYIDVEINLTGMEFKRVKDFKEEVKGKRVKCIMLADPEYLHRVEEALRAEKGDRFTIARSKPFFLEVTKKDIDKGHMLKKLVDSLGMDMEEVIAVGDSYNDLAMLRTAGTSVAVANAKPEIKEAVDYITSSNDEGGIAGVIERFIDTY